MAADYLFAADPLGKGVCRGGIFLALDFDGTLVPIRKDPSECFLSGAMRRDLEMLASTAGCNLMVLSGRSMADIKKRVGLRGIFYGGNHGLDISGRDFRYTHEKALLAKPVIDCMKRLLKREIKHIDGAWVEDKKYSLSLHFRMVKKNDLARTRDIFYQSARDFMNQGPLGIIEGKKVLEVVPDKSWNKGSAIRLIMKHMNNRTVPVFIGDDTTDETVFNALARNGITVRVGWSRETAAKYYLKGRHEVNRFLRYILEHAGQ